jgi:hypothetical protein
MLWKFNLILICSIAVLFSCGKQDVTLLPEANTLELTAEHETGITTFYTFEVKGQLDVDELFDFPKTVDPIDGKTLIKWHKITELEKSDFQDFITTEQADNEICQRLFLELQSDEYLISILYDTDKQPLGLEGYSVYDWVDLYFLNVSKKQLTHISYGKF